MTAPVLGHVTVIPPRLGAAPYRASGELLAHFRDCSACDVTDVVGRLYSMDSGIRPLYSPMERAVGIALTVKAVPGDNLAIHTALGLVQPDDFLVVDWRGHTEGCGTGVLSLIDPIRQGLTGVVVDGSWRDVDDIQALSFPIFGRGIAPFSPLKENLGEVNVPVACGGVIVEPGDIIVADEGGIAVVPLRHAEQVATAVEKFVVRTSLEEYPLDELRSGAIARRHRLQQLFEQQGGLIVGHATKVGAEQ
jgi:4-hydroxy-4-methyl-2-oxoglutarate aldolase